MRASIGNVILAFVFAVACNGGSGGGGGNIGVGGLTMGDSSGGGDACDPAPTLWMSDCSDGCGPVMTCFSSCPSCTAACQIACDSDFDCARYGAGFCRSQDCTDCTRVCSGPPTTCEQEVQPGTDCTVVSAYECTCAIATATNGQACSTAEVPGGMCCASGSWPDQGGSCRCYVPELTCKYTFGTTCDCDDFGTGTLDACTGDVCCLIEEEFTCRCVGQDDASLCSGYPSVPSCSPGVGLFEGRCNEDEVEVASCAE